MPMLSRCSESVCCEIPKIYGYQLPALAAVYFTRNVDILLECHHFETCDIFQPQCLSTSVLEDIYMFI